jgi:hypothetical protein
MCFPLTPFTLEREWKAYGLTCIVVQAREASHRCGYVRVPPTHPSFGKDYNDIDVNVHGGLTFGQIEPCTEHEDGQGYWFGFDCAHYQDASYDPNTDISTVSEHTRKLLEIMSFADEGHYWTQQEVEAECETLAKQLSELV